MTPSELLRLARATTTVLLDSERTEEIHVTEELTSKGRLAAMRRTLFADAEAQDLLRERPELCSEQLDYDGLRALPAHTLGFQYVNHLDAHGLSADSQAAPTRYVEDDEIAYLVRRFRQTHDVWHALTGLGTAGHEEVLLHAFSWGQLKLPVSALVVVFGGIKHLLLEARFDALAHGLGAAHRAGREAAPLLPVYWERWFDAPMDDVRTRLGVARCAG